MQNETPHQNAKDLSIGVILPTSLELCRQILIGVRSAAEEAGLGVHLIADTAAPPHADMVDTSRMPPLAGIVAHISSDREFAQTRQIAPIVVGTSNRDRKATPGPLRVLNDEAAIGAMGAEYLLSLGFRHLVFLDKLTMRYSGERREGFVRAARDAGTRCEVVGFYSSPEMGGIAAELLKEAPPIGLMAESDVTAREFIDRTPDRRRFIPRHIAVLGTDDDTLQNALSRIGLSSVRTAGQQIGLQAARLVMAVRAGGQKPAHPIRIRPSRVIERASTNALAIDDPQVLKAVRLLKENVSDFRTVNDLVEATGVHRRTLEMHFRKALNRTMADELHHARLEAARRFLESSDLTIAEIAEEVGYSEYRLLTLAFRRITGETPTAYRKRTRRI